MGRAVAGAASDSYDQAACESSNKLSVHSPYMASAACLGRAGCSRHLQCLLRCLPASSPAMQLFQCSRHTMLPLPPCHFLQASDLKSIFEAFAAFGSREPVGGMEGRAFSK